MKIEGLYRQHCHRQQCKDAADGSGDPEACQDYHQAQGLPGSPQTECLHDKPQSAVQRVDVIHGSRDLQTTTAAQIRDDMFHNQMLGNDIPAENEGLLVASDSSNTSTSVEHNQHKLIRRLVVLGLVIAYLAVELSVGGAQHVPDMMHTRVGWITSGRRATQHAFMTEAFQAARWPLRPLLNFLYTLFWATCSMHCDAKYRGYYSPRARECLTVFCDEPVRVLIVKADMRLTGTNPEKETCDVAEYILRKRDTLVIYGAAGQVCAHQVIAPPGHWCVRVRTFWVCDE